MDFPLRQSTPAPVPAPVMRFLRHHATETLAPVQGTLTPGAPLFWSSWRKRGSGKTRTPMTGKNIWRLCKVYGARIRYPVLKPHDLQHRARGRRVYNEARADSSSIASVHGVEHGALHRSVSMIVP